MSSWLLAKERSFVSRSHEFLTEKMRANLVKFQRAVERISLANDEYRYLVTFVWNSSILLVLATGIAMLNAYELLRRKMPF